MLDLFSGIGGFHKGFERAKYTFDWVGFCEIDKYASAVYRHRFPKAEELGDVKLIQPGRDLPNHIDLLCGGFPCQAFSVAGNRRGFDDSFLKLHGFSNITKKIGSQSPVWFSKMLKAYLVTTVDEHFLSCTKFLVTLGIPLNSRFSILGGGYPKIESGYTLSDILETEVDQKYFLSEKSVQQLVRSKKKGMPSPVLMHPTTKEQMEKEQ